jgi:hypothetical protein
MSTPARRSSFRPVQTRESSFDRVEEGRDPLDRERESAVSGFDLPLLRAPQVQPTAAGASKYRRIPAAYSGASRVTFTCFGAHGAKAFRRIGDLAWHELQYLLVRFGGLTPPNDALPRRMHPSAD